MKTRVLITGGSGFIGTNLINELIIEGFELLNIDIAKPKIAEHIPYWSKIDIRQYTLFRKTLLLFNPDYIIHLAARTDLDGKSIQDYDSNTIGVENLMRICQDLTDLKKIIITSSMLVCRSGYKPKNDEDFQPSTLYGHSKVMTEKIVKQLIPLCDWAIIRPTSIWGPWFNKPYRDFFDMVISKRYIHLGNKSCTKTYGFILNSTYQIKSILFNDTSASNNKVFYIGDYSPLNIELWANAIASQLGYNIKKLPFWVFKLGSNFGDIMKILGINFPLTSFRLKNMTTNNIIFLDNTKKLCPILPYTTNEGINLTLKWINSHEID